MSGLRRLLSLANVMGRDRTGASLDRRVNSHIQFKTASHCHHIAARSKGVKARAAGRGGEIGQCYLIPTSAQMTIANIILTRKAHQMTKATLAAFMGRNPPVGDECSLVDIPTS